MGKKFYTGIGSRETPQEIMEFMGRLAKKLEEDGWTLRSGAADGADIAFERGVVRLKEIYLPWRGFNGSKSNLYDVSEKAQELASAHHPAWQNLKDAVRKLMGRNAYQVLGQNLDLKSSFVVCWTPDGCESGETRTNKTGGTGLAISLASSLGIPVFNLANEESYARVEKFLAA